MAQQKIDTEQPVETITGGEAVITGTNDEHGTLVGFIVENDRKYSVMWNAYGEPIVSKDRSFSIRNKAAPVAIDPTKPVRTLDGREVINLEQAGDGIMVGHIVTKPGHCTGLVYWGRCGHGMTVGYRDENSRLINVEEPEPIKTDSPVETVQGCKVHLENFGVSDGSLTGTVVMSNGSLVRMSWDRFGKVTVPGYSEVWNIRNRPPQPTPEQIEAKAIEQFYAALEDKLGEDYADRTYEDAVVSGDFGFVRDQQMDGMWEAWAIPDAEGCTTQLAHGLPAYIGRNQIAKFYEWHSIRLEQAADKAYERGNAAGRKEAAAYIKRAHTAYLTAMNGIGDFFEKDEYIPF